MAKNIQNTSSVTSNTFNKDLKKDVNDIYLPPNSWVHARNAINNSKTGDLGKIGNEPANQLCAEAPYTIIGTVHLEADKWAIFSTNNTNSEIGLFFEDICSYYLVVNDNCLNFNTANLIKGTSRATSDCVYELYWDDGFNPSRFMPVNIIDPLVINPFTNPNSPIPWIQVPAPGIPGGPPCFDLINSPALDCSRIRIAKLLTPPCIEVNKGVGGGTLLNGSYMVAIAYAIRGQKISDYYVSNIQSLFDHDNSTSSLDVEVLSMDTRYDEVIVVLISIVNQQAVAHQAGIYSTRQTRYSFDVIQDSWPTVPIEQIPIMTPVDDKTDAMYSVGQYLIRTGTTSKLDFNYQPFANQIVTKWSAVEYPSDYYRKGGNNTNYLRDEVYSFFIRYVYDTGDKSAAYHIPGRAPFPATDLAPAGINSLPGDTAFWQANNTATLTPLAPTPIPDGGVEIAEGYMGYWQSTELYPTDKPEVWNSGVVTPPYPGTLPADYDLCGLPIRHHKFPEETIINPSTGVPTAFTQTRLYNPANGNIRILGVKFENILPPVENPQDLPSQWRYITNIIGYEILRGTRNGNKTIIAKGIINNMVRYDIEGNSSKTGLYPNYPYNDLTTDRFLSTSATNWSGGFTGGSEQGYNPIPASDYVQDNFTFHSPDTNFNRPFLGMKELKIYGEINGASVGKFEVSEKHPKEKLITDLTFLISAIVGIGISNLAMNGERRVIRKAPISPGYSQNGFSVYQPTLTNTTWVAPYGNGNSAATHIGSIVPMVAPNNGAQPKTTDTPIIPTAATAVNTGFNGYDAALAAGAVFTANLTGQPVQSATDASYATLNTAYNQAVSTTRAFTSSSRDVEQSDGQLQRIPIWARTVAAFPMFVHYFTQGSDEMIRLIKAMLRFKDFALRYHSHAFYNNYSSSVNGNRRRLINQANYIGPQITEFVGNTRINNLYRSNTVVINVSAAISNPTVVDRTRIRVTDVTTPGFTKDPTKSEITSSNAGSGITMVASSHYAGLKQRINNQYGQLTNIIQVPVSTCNQSIKDPISGNPFWITKLPLKSQVLFGGDNYIGRYTEKNTFFYFYDWLYNQPDGAQLNYYAHRMLPFPRYWANFDGFETSDFTTNFFSNFPSFPTGTASVPWLPSNYYNLDGLQPSGSFLSSINIRFGVKDAWFYLFSSGVRDFFVESEINIDLRDWGEADTEKHYDPYRYTDTKSMFDTAIIKAGNYYKYDSSLSVARLFTNYFSWANTQPRDYSPFLAETCYVYRPRRVIYSLPAQFEGRRDNWLIFLPNNYYDFLAKVTCIKPVNKSGAVIFFDSASPVEFQGTDQLQTSLGTKLTIGDGGLFSQPMQALTNADRPHEYGSCQDRLSVINTPVGLFWISENQGKIFHLKGEGIQPISDMDLKWWFNSYLPYKLKELFPNFQLIDNPVVGIGCQSVYDNENGLVYFCKKDYILRQGFTPNLTPIGQPATGPGNIQYNGGTEFIYIPTGARIQLGNPLYFEDASWTVSYDVKTGGWLGWHDWHPELTMPGKNTFMSIVTNPTSRKGGIWIHNERCDLYCNYYGVNYPFEIEYKSNTPQQVNTIRSVEYYLEVFKYDPNCYDRFHVLDYNFDEAVIYNTEQCSGMLRLTPNPRPDPQLMIQYPIVNPTFIEILFSKIENKYRFNQFWDITDDRGEYPLYPLPPVAQRMIWNTAANGYVKSLNAANLNYNKAELQRKKFRHYTNSVFLRKRVIVGQQMTYKMLVLIANTKELNSPR